MKIPHVSSKVDENVINSLASANDIRNKKKAKDYVDKKKRAQYSTINVGDYVLLQQDKTGKLSTKFDHRPYKVTHKEGCIVTVEREGRVLKRSTRHCKLVPNYNEVEQDNDETDSESIHLDKQDRIVNEPNRRYPIRNRRPPQRHESLHT